MNTKIFKKILVAGSIGCCLTAVLTACSEDDNLGEAPRLFRPVASLESSSNTIKATWDDINGATEYKLTLQRVKGTDEAGENVYEDVKSATCTGSPYTFSDLAWDEKYRVNISCASASKSSGIYTTSDVTVNYISSLTDIKLIDNAARLSWKTTGDVIKAIVAKDAEGNEKVLKVKTDSYNAGYADINGLKPETEYTFFTYKDSEIYDNSTYAGKMSGTTKESVNFDEKYGEGKWIDIRDWDLSEHADTLQTEDFWKLITEGMTVILRGEQQYKVNNNIKFNRSVTFITGSTLGGNAVFLSSGGLTCDNNATVEKIKFEDIDFISDKAMPGGGFEIGTNTEKGFGGRQVFNNNNTASTVKELIFKNCTMTGYRAIVRAQNASDAIQNITFNGCIINGVGDQGVVTTSNKAADWQNITFQDCTITNIVMLCDLRATANALTMNIKNCTFCYAPIETTSNANTPMFRFVNNAATLNIENTLFGPSMQSEGGTGDKINTYTPGTNGSIFLNGASVLTSVSKSFKTNFVWTPIGEAGTTYPVDGLSELAMDEIGLWQKPSEGDFKIIGNVPESGVGDSRWNK